MHNLYQLVTFIYFPNLSKSFQIKLLVADLVADSTRRVAPSPFAFGDFLRRVVRGGWGTLGTPWEHMGLFDRVQPHGDHGVTVSVGILVKNNEKHHGFQAYLTGRVPHFQTKP